MALSTSEKALAILLGVDEVLLGGKGVASRAAKKAFNATARGIVATRGASVRAAPVVGRGLTGVGRAVLPAAYGLARAHPVPAAIATGYAAHELGLFDPAYEALERERQMAAESYAITAPTIIPELKRTYGSEGAKALKKRAVSKANRAVKRGMALLKSGTKAQTGSQSGNLPKGAFKIATKAAGLANPKTKSKVGKGKSKVNILAKKLRGWW